jgi:hypothetical protein
MAVAMQVSTQRMVLVGKLHPAMQTLANPLCLLWNQDLTTLDISVLHVSQLTVNQLRGCYLCLAG